MKISHLAASIAAAALVAGAPLAAQTTTETQVSTGTSVKDGVATTKRTVTHTTKRKTRQPRKILGVKVGTKTAVSKTTKETKTSSNGDQTTTVKTSH